MVARSRSPYRWKQALTESLLLGALCGSAQAAVAPTTAAGTALTLDSADTMSRIGGTNLYLETSINGTAHGLAHFGLRDGQLWASIATLRELGFTLPAGTPDPVRIASLRGTQVNYDAEHQSVRIMAPLDLLNLSTHVLDADVTRGQQASASPGMLLNYNLYGTQDTHDGSSLSAFTELRAFNSAGVLSSTALSQANLGNGNWRDSSVRLDTSWSASFPDRLLTLRVGDTLTAATSWSRPTRIGGVQFGSNFALQPYDITTPLPEFFGSATLPSQVDLYVNGVKQYSGEVPAGRFQLNGIPSISGAGQAQVLLTDALGRVTTLDFSLYGTQQLLRQGLTDWSAELGVVREDYGLRSFDYGHDPVASGTWRYGFSNRFTGEAHGEAGGGLGNAGLGGNWLLGAAGVVTAAAAMSHGNGLDGSQMELGYQWNNNRFNLSAHAIRASSGYRDVASLYGAPPPALTASAQAGFSTAHAGSFGLNYVQLRYRGAADNRYASAYWYKSMGRRLSVNLAVNQNLDQNRDRSFMFVFNLSLDDDIFLSSGVQHDQQRTAYTLNASSPVPSGGGLGWNAQWQQGDGDHSGRAEADYLGRYGQLQGGIASYNGDRQAFAGASGALVLMDSHLFAARQIYDGFALVSTSGVADVPVKLQNNPIGTTDQHGLLLVTPLNAYQDNKLSIDPMDLPADMQIARVDATATPTDRAGVLVKFDIKPVNAALLVLVDATGKPLPLGSSVRLQGQAGEPVLVGFDGQAYLETLHAHNVLEATLPDGNHCQVAFDYHREGGDIPQIGPLSCRRRSP